MPPRKQERIPHTSHSLDEYQNKGLTKCIPLKLLILKGRKFHNRRSNMLALSKEKS